MTALLARHGFPIAIGAVATAFLGLFFLYPVLSVFGASVLDPAGAAFTLRNYATVLSSPFFLQALGNSLTVAATASALAILLGVPFAFCSVHCAEKFRADQNLKSDYANQHNGRRQ